MQAVPVTHINESNLARWLFSHPIAYTEIGAVLGLADPLCIGFEIPPQDIVPKAPGPGDIDVLLCPSASPDRAVAIELKRVKIRGDTFHTQLPGKLRELKHGVQQANLLHALGLHRTILMIAIVTDGRERVGLNFASRGPTSPLIDPIDHFSGSDRLVPEIGLVFVEITQPVDKEISEAGAIVARVARDGERRDQSPALTGRISQVLCRR